MRVLLRAVEQILDGYIAGTRHGIVLDHDGLLRCGTAGVQLTAQQPAYPGPHVNLAIVYLHDGRRDDARKALERALAIEPGHAAANTQLGILLREEGKFAEAEQAYRRALATDPQHALAHYNFGVLLDIYLRRTAEALEHYELYQASLTEPNETVGRWIIDLRRRVGNGEAARVAQEDGR